MAGHQISPTKALERQAERLQRDKDDDERDSTPLDTRRDRLLDAYLAKAHRLPTGTRLQYTAAIVAAHRDGE
jgi:hypothetical protein